MVRLVILLSLVFWFKPLKSFGQSKIGGKTIIVIDPGHGGTDSGAMGINGNQEKDMVLRIAKKVVSLNKSLLRDSYDIHLARYDDTFISLRDRAALAKELNADLFISLHCNHSDNSRAKGVEVYVPKKGKHLRSSILLAYQLQKGLSQNIGYENRGVKFANFQVLRETVGYCPTVLVELGFLSNQDEAQHLTEDENILALALSLLSCLNIKN